MDWGCTIDWSLALEAANVLVLVIGLWTARTIANRVWRERTANRMAEVAEDALSNMYEAEDVFMYIRQNFSRVAVEDLNERASIRAAKTTFQRINDNKEFFERARNIAPRIKSIFGTNQYKEYMIIFEIRNDIINAAHNYVDFDDDNPSEETRNIMKSTRKILYQGFKKDEISERLNRATSNLEAEFLPIIRANSTRR
jgi:hypothetical protein